MDYALENLILLILRLLRACVDCISGVTREAARAGTAADAV
jgi:hypothetical protein